MTITYHGLGAVKIDTNKTTLIVDPYDKKSGLKPLRGKAEIVLLSHLEAKLPSGIINNPFVIDTPGEYDLQGIAIQGFDHKGHIIYSLNSEDINLVHLTNISNDISDDKISRLGNDIDVLFLPIGGNNTLNNDQASKLISKLEPNIVVPIYYGLPNLTTELDSLDKFKDEMGLKGVIADDKLKLKKKDVLGEKTEVRILAAA